MSHHLFANDNLFFFKGNEWECRVIKHIVSTYEATLGQAINFNKSSIFFSTNVTYDIMDVICRILEVHSPLDHDRYLGLPSLIGRSEKAIFSYLKERV